MPRFDSAQRSAILARAMEVFAAKGLKGATVRAVGDAAGVNSALIYYYFENKEALFVSALQEVLRGLIARLQERVRPFADGPDRLSFLVDGILDYYGAHPERMRLMSVAVSLHASLFGQVIDRFVKDQALLPLEVLQEGMARQQLRTGNPALAWWSILGICIFALNIKEVLGHVDFGALPFQPPDMAHCRQPIIDLLAHGLAVAAKPSRGSKGRRRR